jgi:PIN like domain
MKEQPDIVFFTDRDLGKQFPAILKEAGIHVERHIDHFADNAKDEEWLSEIGKRGWYAITHDRRIRSKPNERAAVRKFRVGLFIVVGKAPFPELANNYVLTYTKISRFIKRYQRPFIAKIYRSEVSGKKEKAGYIKMWESF